MTPHIHAVFVNYNRTEQFIDKVKAESNCRILNVSEWLSNELLEYMVECPESKKEYITELAFMTFITNPEFQKYYEK